MRVAATDIEAVLVPLGFEMQERPDEMVFVRPSATEGLFERVECVYVGSEDDRLVLSVALSVVRRVAVQFRGLLVRGGWRELCNEPGRGRVALRTADEVGAWLARLRDLAPARFEMLVREKGSVLLSTTKKARDYAAAVAETLVGRALENALREPFRDLTAEQVKDAEEFMQLPLVVPSAELESVASVAVAAMIRAGDESISQVLRAPTSISMIGRMKAVPADVHWRIRLLIDRILTLRDSR